MRRPLASLAALLLVAACSLTHDVDKYGQAYVDPRSCGPSGKFCDGACNPGDDPTRGCLEAGCAPCDPFPHAGLACGTDGKCAPGKCDAGWADCNGDPLDGCEAKLDADAAHCGRCGHGCGGGECRGGACQPAALASGQASPGEIALDDTFVYFTNYSLTSPPGAVMRVSKAGGEVSPVANAQRAWGLAVSGSDVFFGTFSDPHVVARAPKDGSAVAAPTTLSNVTGKVRGVAADADYVFFCNYDKQSLVRWSRQAGTSVAFAADKPNDVFVDGTDVIWSNEGTAGTGSIVRLPREAASGATPEPLASSRNQPRGVTADKAHVYFVDTGTSATSGDGAVVRVARAGGEPQTLASGLKNPRELAIDDEWVYFTSYADGTVMRVKKAGGAPEVLASGQAAPLGIAVDATYVYWANYTALNATNGAVMRLAKP